MASFLISGSGRGEGAQLLGWRPDCMGFAMQVTTEWKRGHFWDILATFQPHSLGTGDKCPPPCFRVLFGNVQQCSILRDQTTEDLKSHHLQAGVTALSVPPPFLSAVHDFLDFLRALTASSGGGGGHVPLRPRLGSGTGVTYTNQDIVTATVLHYIIRAYKADISVDTMNHLTTP